MFGWYKNGNRGNREIIVTHKQQVNKISESKKLYWFCWNASASARQKSPSTKCTRSKERRRNGLRNRLEYKRRHPVSPPSAISFQWSCLIGVHYLLSLSCFLNTVKYFTQRSIFVSDKIDHCLAQELNEFKILHR